MTKTGLILLNIIGFFIVLSAGSKVLELSDRFIDVRENGLWFVKFYAPWCGHCKKLEPIWNQVAQDLHFSNVRVGRVDCTRFPSVASEFDIRGYPTILFFKGGKTYAYTGDRVREEIVQFALRLEGSAVQKLYTVDDLNLAKEKHDVFFLGVAKNVETDDALWNIYNSVAEQFQTTSYFYSMVLDSLSDHKSILTASVGETVDGVYVFKDNMVYKFANVSGDVATLNESLVNWILLERFPNFVKVTHGSFPLLLKTDKFLVTAVMEENLIEKLTPEMEEYRKIIKSVADKHLEEFRDHFIFGWAPYPSVVNSVAMQRLEAPTLIVVNSQTYQYYAPDVSDPSEMSAEIVVTFLRGILNKTEKARGGNGFFSRLYRVYFDVTSTLFDMWAGNPVLTAVLFGLPLGFLSLICYSICCADILDANDEEDREDDDIHEKNE
ncbi:hypothetical protein CHUAL_011758 [Chamberlinius hualienensis]